MSTPAPIDPKVPVTANPAEAAPVGPSFEERLRLFWEKNARMVYALCAVILLAIIGRGGFEYYENQKEEGVRADYSAAATPEKLKAFIAQNPKHSLSGVASLRLADEAYSAGNYVEAQTNYQRAGEILKGTVLGGRALVGAAVSKVSLGQTAEGEEKLKQIANDASLAKPSRAEAAYHLATLALDAGRTDDATKYLDLVSTVDQTGLWPERALALRASLPGANTATPANVSIKVPAKP